MKPKFMNARDEIDFDYNGSFESASEFEAFCEALEYPVGDLFDDDTYWMDEDGADEEE